METAELGVIREVTLDSRRAAVRGRRLLGGILIKEGLITRAQLDEALRLQEARVPHQMLGQILVEQKAITQPQLVYILDKHHKKYRLGDVLVETRLITPDQLERALAHQRSAGLRLGEVLMQRNLITERQLKRALSIQLKIAFVDLDECPLDPGLSRLISERYARHHRVVPIAKTADRITLAMDDPTDLEVVDELRASTGCPIDVVTSTREAMDRAFTRVYGERRGAATEPRSPELEESYAQRGDEEMERARAEPPPWGPAVPELEASPDARDTSAAFPQGEGEPAMVQINFADLRASVGAVRQIAGEWEAFLGAIETLLHGQEERRAALERLERELQEELDAKAQAFLKLQAAHQAVLRKEEAYAQALSDLRQKYETLVQDREFTMDRLEVLLRRFKP